MKTRYAIFSVALLHGIFTASWAGAQMMGSGMNAAIMCPGFQGNSGLMRDPSVSFAVQERSDGFTVEWTSKDPEKVKALKRMAQQMRLAHADQLKPSAK
jgi:hypothetical protein